MTVLPILKIVVRFRLAEDRVLATLAHSRNTIFFLREAISKLPNTVFTGYTVSRNNAVGFFRENREGRFSKVRW